MNKKKLREMGIHDDSFEFATVKELIKKEILVKPLDGNHGQIHPKSKDFVESGIPFIMATDIHDGTIDYDNCKYITKRQADNLQKGFSRNGDVLLTHKASIGRTAIVNNNFPYTMLTPQVTYYRVKDKNKLNNRYLKYYFDSSFFQKTIGLWSSSGGTRAYIGITEQQKLPIIFPPIGIQKKIAAIISAYDKLIEINTQRIQILEKMAEEIYKEWFVRMRFPGYEKAKIVKGIPERWDIKPLGVIINLTMGQSPKSEFYNTYGDGLPFNQGVGTYGKRFPNRENYCNTKGRIASEGDILFSVRAPVGRINIADTKMIIGRGLAAINHKEGFNSYLFYMLKSYFDTEDIIGNGSIFNSVGKEELKKFKVIQPNKELIILFEDFAKPLDVIIQNLYKQVEKLTKTKALLLPRLISGKLSVENLDIKFPPSMEEVNA
jgi:type I restriction enzyme, S subunit